MPDTQKISLMKRNQVLTINKHKPYDIRNAGLWGFFSIALALLIPGCNKPIVTPTSTTLAWVRLPVLARKHPSMRQINDIDRQLILLNKQIHRAGGIIMPNSPEIKVTIFPLPALNMPLDIKVDSKKIDKVFQIELAAAEKLIQRKFSRRRDLARNDAEIEMNKKNNEKSIQLKDELYNIKLKIAKENSIPIRSAQLNRDNITRIRKNEERANLIGITKADLDVAEQKYKDAKKKLETDIEAAEELSASKFETFKNGSEIEKNNIIAEKIKILDEELEEELDELRKQKQQEMDADNRLVSAPESPRSVPIPPDVRMDDSSDAKATAKLQKQRDYNRNNKKILLIRNDMLNLLKKRKKIEELIKKDTQQAINSLGEIHGFNIRYIGTYGAKDITTEATEWLNKYWGK